MSRTVTALYDTKAEAEAARERLSREVDVEGRARIVDQSSTEGQDRESGFGSVPLSHEDRSTYREGLRRGGFMLCADVDEDEDCDKIVSILEQTSSVDLDDRQKSWRAEGWQPGNTGALGSAGSGHGDMNEGASGRVIEEERIPLVEEQLRVGKREFERGGARVRSYVEERPVEETVTLREEHVEVERRPVEQPLSSSDIEKNGLLQERTVEMREKAEEAVVGKTAQVKEEVVIQKTASEHEERVADTVRSTQAEIDENLRPEGEANSFDRDRENNR